MPKPPVHPDMDCLAKARAPAGMFGDSIEEQRKAWTYYSDNLNQPPPADMQVWEEEVAAAEHHVPVRLYRPAGAPADGAPGLVYIHGGGFMKGDLDSSDSVAWGFAEQAGAVGELARAGVQAAVFLAAMFFLGSRVMPRVLETIVRWRSRELFLVAITAAGVGVGYGTYLFGLSFAFGAFVAGLVLSESEFSHQALSDIVPLRDVFGLLFFASAGMLLDPRVLTERPVETLGAALAVMAGKALIFGLIARAFGYVNAAPWIVALGLAQVGEFAFVVARLGESSGALDEEAYSFVLATTLLSMVASPMLMRAAVPIHAVYGTGATDAILTGQGLPETVFSDEAPKLR